MTTTTVLKMGGGQGWQNNVVRPFWEKGGMEDERETEASRVIGKNSWALSLPEYRQWLREMIADPSNHVYDGLTNAFVKRAQDDLKERSVRISRKYALCLHRLFLIRGSQALEDALAVYKDPKNPQLN